MLDIVRLKFILGFAVISKDCLLVVILQSTVSFRFDINSVISFIIILHIIQKNIICNLRDVSGVRFTNKKLF